MKAPEGFTPPSDEMLSIEGNYHAFRAHGLPCHLVRHPDLGHWCGYVGIPRSHTLFGCQDPVWHAVPTPQVHGLISWSRPYCPVVSKRRGPTPEAHTTREWWMGWDAGHTGDYRPFTGPQDLFSNLDFLNATVDALRGDSYGDLHYWTRDQAEAETRRLAANLAHYRGSVK